MLPKTAIPRAPPNSALVSEIPAADPARSGGADPMIRSVVKVNTGAVPSENATDPATMTNSPVEPSIWVDVHARGRSILIGGTGKLYGRCRQRHLRSGQTLGEPVLTIPYRPHPNLRRRLR